MALKKKLIDFSNKWEVRLGSGPVKMAYDRFETPTGEKESKEQYLRSLLTRTSPRVTGHNDMTDAARHAGSALYMTRQYGPLVANALGAAHELRNARRGTLKETISDLKNNFIGSAIGTLPLKQKTQERILDKLIAKKKLSVINK